MLRVLRALLAVWLGASVLVGPAARGQPAPDHAARFRAIRSAIDDGHYAQATAGAREFAASLENDVDRDAAESARARNLLVEALVRNGEGSDARARTLAEEAVQASQTLFGPTHQTFAQSLHNLGEVLVETGEYKLAMPQFERAFDLHARSDPPNWIEAAEDLDRLAWAQNWIQRYEEAQATGSRALEIKERIGAPDAAVARTLSVRGLAWQRKGDYQRARADLDRAVRLAQAARPSHPETAAALVVLGEELELEGNPVEGRRLLTRAVEIAESTLRPEHPDIASSLRSLAIPVEDLGDLLRARSLRERGLDIAEKSLGPSHPLVAIQLNDLAISLYHYGDLLGAGRLYERALAIYERRLGKDSPYATTVVHNLAVLNNNLGDFREATRLERRVLATWEHLVGPDHPWVTHALFFLANTLAAQGRDREAVPLYERSMRTRERTLGPNSSKVAEVLTSLAASSARLGQRRRALELSSRALQIWEQSGVPAGLADALSVYGDIQVADRDYAGARTSYARAMSTRSQVFGPSHPTVAESEVALASVLPAVDASQEALTRALHGEELGRDHLRLMLRSLPERQGLEYAVTRAKGLDVALSLVASHTEPESDALVFDAVIRGRGLVLDEMAERSLLRADAARPELALRWEALVSARQRFANLAIQGTDGASPERFANLLSEARAEKERAERAFAEQSGSGRAERRRADAGLGDVRRALPAQSALVALVRYDRTVYAEPVMKVTPASPADPRPSRRIVPSYLAFVIRGASSETVVVPLGSAAAIDALVARWREETTGVFRAQSPSEAEAAYRTAGAALRQRVWDPLKPHLKEASTVFVVLDGSLTLVSLAAMPVGSTQYLIEQGPVIHYLSAERDLVSAGSPSSSTLPQTKGLLAVGGASFDDESSFTPGRRPAVAPDGAAAGCGTLQSAHFPPLAGTRLEVRAVAALWTDSAVRILEGREASEGAFKREAPGHRVLHLATHGFFLRSDCAPVGAGTRSVGGLTTVKKAAPRPTVSATVSDNPLLRSGLALAGANRRAAAGPGDEDGILTAEEVTTLDLSGVEWAVLSACETGLGEVRAGEGVFGLRRAFQIAGVHTVIMSLWSVDDDAAQRWMRALYVNRLQKHLDTAHAMHAASLSMLSGRRTRGESTHPFYWAAFVAAGDWR